MTLSGIINTAYLESIWNHVFITVSVFPIFFSNWKGIINFKKMSWFTLPQVFLSSMEHKRMHVDAAIFHTMKVNFMFQKGKKPYDR